MASSRFIKDTGLTVRMTLSMFALGALFVALVVGVLAYVRSPGGAVLVAVIAIGMAFWQWWSSDKMAMRAMRAREVTPEEAPELHGMIDRLCALADMPKPRVGVSDLALANAFATGRSPDRAVVCVTTGILQTLDAEELEAVLAHELSHVAHRDVLVMTVASSAGIAAGLLMRFTQFGGLGRSRNSSALPVVLVVLAREPARLRRELPAAAPAVALPRAERRPRGRLPHAQAGGTGVGPAEDQRRVRRHPHARPARRQRGERAVHRAGPARWRRSSGLMATHPPLQQRLSQLARIQAELSRPTG